jgi:glycine/D-amino acid oxidase-like deaminating enzyme
LADSPDGILDADTARQHDVRSGRAPWINGHRPARQPLRHDRRCDVVVVGGGITGSMVAEQLVSAGHDVCVVDRERPGLGSTAASTAMLLWEIDRPLGFLTDLYGFDRAAGVYRRSLRAVSGLQTLIQARAVRCSLRQRQSLYLASGTTGARELMAEHALRTRAGLPGAFLDYRTLRREFDIDREAAILSPGSADADPLCLAHQLMGSAVTRGACLVDGNAIDYQSTGRGVTVAMEDGHAIEADWVVLATGYVMPDFVTSDLHQISSSWAIATPPQPAERRWRDDVLIWEASEQYLYARTTADHRIIVGGEDDEAITEPDDRARATPAKAEAILAKLAALLPPTEARAELAWSGAFGTTVDGLPLIGAVPGHPRMLAAYGYGGNGITFSFIAAHLIAGLVGGRHEDWHDDFRLDRPLPKAIPTTEG